MPRPLRYAAVAAIGGRILIAGGTSGTQAVSDILSFDPQTGRIRRIGRLPHPLTHAAGAALAGRFYVIGGRSDSLTGQTRTIVAVDPATGAVHRAGRLPVALSDTGAASLGDRVLVLGGRDATGAVHDAVLELTQR
jgi:N-acetylneuraminic acid mutarotase